MNNIEDLAAWRAGAFNPNADWADPQMLPDGMPAVPPFEPELLPAVFRPWITDVAERMQCPADYPAVGVMVAAAALIGRRVAIRPKQRDDWTVVPNLWGVIVGRPSLLKTPALDEALRPVRALEAEAAKRFKEDQARAETAAAVGKIAKEESIKAATKAFKTGGKAAAMDALQADQAPEEAPIRRRYLTNDSTIEALGVLLRQNPNGVLVFRDELSGFLRQMDREGHESDRAFYLEAWNGTGGFTYDRIGRGTIDIDAACVSILGGIQPGPLADYLAAAARGGAGDDGLVQRFQLAVWPDAPPTWSNIDRFPNTYAKRQAHAALERLDAIEAAALGAEQDPTRDAGVAFLRFDPEAQVLFDQWRTNLEHRLRAGYMHPALEAHLAKYRSLVPSLALISHLIDGGTGPVPAAQMARAAGWAEYLEGHARRLYASAIHPGEHAARALAERIQAGALPNPFTRREVLRPRWGALADATMVQEALEILVGLDWLRAELVAPSGGGRPTVRYHTNPKLRNPNEL